MQKGAQMAGLFAALLTVGGCFNNWDVLGPEDLPLANEILTIESPTRLVIREGETGYLGGRILVEEDGVLSMTVEGELSVPDGSYAVIETRGGRMECILEGSLHGANFGLTNGAGGSSTLDAARGSIDIGNANIRSEAEGILTWTSNGMRVNNMNVQNCGAVTNINDTGVMQVNNMTLKDQGDETGTGGLTLTCNDAANNNLTAVANGSGSSLDMVLQGQAAWNNINVHANYGGNVRIDAGAEATVSFEHLYVACSGASHGRLSSGELVNAGDLAVETFLIPDGCDCQDITEPPGPSTWLVTYPAGETFSIINTGTLNMQLPL